MGRYINKDSKGNKLPSLDKVHHLIQDGAVLVAYPKFQPNLICVVENGYFDAAAYCYSEDEFRAFIRFDGRAKTWLIHPKAAEISDY